VLSSIPQSSFQENLWWARLVSGPPIACCPARDLELWLRCMMRDASLLQRQPPHPLNIHSPFGTPPRHPFRNRWPEPIVKGSCYAGAIPIRRESFVNLKRECSLRVRFRRLARRIVRRNKERISWPNLNALARTENRISRRAINQRVTREENSFSENSCGALSPDSCELAPATLLGRGSRHLMISDLGAWVCATCADRIFLSILLG